jgi:DNA-binding response OmpR family regulator
MNEDSQVLLEAGNVRWLQKPFSAAELTSLIRYQLLEQD